jgi:hypothetical protein
MEYYNKYYEGIFWLPEKEDYKIIATFFIDENGCTTITSIQPIVKGKPDHHMRNKEKISVVFGLISCNEYSKSYSVKLYDVLQTHHNMGSVEKFKYVASNSFITVGYDEDISKLNYTQISFTNEIISNWINITGFQIDSEVKDVNSFNQIYKSPESIELFKSPDYTIKIVFGFTAGFPVRRKSYINEKALIQIETSSCTAKDIFIVNDVFQRLLSLLLLLRLTKTTIELKSEGGKTYLHLDKAKEYNRVWSDKMDFNYFTENSNVIIGKWLAKYGSLELAIKNYFSVFGQKGVLIENEFLTYVSIIENHCKNNVDKEAMKQLFEKHKDNFHSSLKYDNLVIKILYVLNSSLLKEKFPDIIELAKKIKTTRNFHAHLEEKHEEESLSVDQLTRVNKILSFTIREFLLKEIGVDNLKEPYWMNKMITEINL